jgi:integrase
MLEEWIKKLEKNARNPKPDAPIFREAAAKWATEILPDAVKPQVARRYKTSIIALDRVMGRIPVNEIDGTVISEFISARRCQVSNATIRRDLTALSSLLTACGSWGWVKDGNVAAKFDRKIVKERRELISMMDRDALGRVMDELPGSMADLLTLLDQTGMRLNEAVTLERWQLDYDKGQVYLDKTKTNRPRVISFKTAGGDAGPLLAKYKDAKGQLFTNRNGDTYQNFSSNFGQVIRRLIARAKAKKRPFKRFRVHDLRHMFAIRWLQNFGNIYKLQKHLGHTSVKTTEMYLEYVGEKEQEAARFGLTGVFSETAQMTAQPESKAGRSTKPKQNNVGI